MNGLTRFSLSLSTFLASWCVHVQFSSVNKSFSDKVSAFCFLRSIYQKIRLDETLPTVYRARRSVRFLSGEGVFRLSANLGASRAKVVQARAKLGRESLYRLYDPRAGRTTSRLARSDSLFQDKSIGGTRVTVRRKAEA
ncbi:hypothetical protein QTP88_021159 [Uroleucon formosanum]